jgi:hypothetical protein
MRMRSSRAIAYTAGWATLTTLAAAAVWWGLGPLLTPVVQSAAVPAQPSLSASPNPPASVASVAPAPSRSPAMVTAAVSPKPKPSMFEGWQFVNGVFTQTFTLEGGTATVRISDGRVSLVSAEARNGYTATPRQPSAQRLVVEFFDGTHFFVLDAMWWENRPYATVTQVS